MSEEFDQVYNPEKHWIANGKLHIERKESIDNYCFDIYKLQEWRLIDVLKNIQFKTVLEIGCGFGRVTNLILNEFSVDKYVAMDISKDQLSNAREHLHQKHTVEYVQGDITNTIDLSDAIMKRKFDLVIATETLMHIKPDKIFDVIGTMLFLSNKHIINIDYYTEENEQLRNHNFKHNYEGIYNEYRSKQWNHSTKTLEIIKIGDTKQYLFHATL